MSDTYLNNVDTEKLNKLVEETNKNVNQFNDICANVIRQHSKGLDDLMAEIYSNCIRDRQGNEIEAPLNRLEYYYLELSNTVYFMIEQLEQLGVYSDLADNAAKEVYSKSYLHLSKNKDTLGKSKSTVAELQARASLDSQYESVVRDIYDHAYKVIKGKISSAQDMMNCLRKIITSRNNEMQLSLTNRGDYYAK